MGRQTRTVISSSSKGDAWQQPGGDVPGSETANAGDLPIDTQIVPDMDPHMSTNLGDSQASLSIPAGSKEGSKMGAEEQDDYDLCFEPVDTPEDGYTLVELEPTPKARPSGKEASEM